MMDGFTTITVDELTLNPFKTICADWMLITAGMQGDYNTMTASWGSLGVIWNKPAATVYVRHTRYTFEFMERYSSFTLSFFGGNFRKALNFCGTKSGREFDKAAETGLTPVTAGDSTAFAEASLVLVCRKMYYQDMDETHFIDEEIDTFYLNKDYHRIYIGEISKIYRK
jgi:flavin reductase (DIM6/NTAB) family NADH-FMN oxidoreductase RutF